MTTLRGWKKSGDFARAVSPERIADGMDATEARKIFREGQEAISALGESLAAIKARFGDL